MPEGMQIVGLTDTEVQEFWKLYVQNPTYADFTRCITLYLVNVTNKTGVQATQLAFKTWQIFQNTDEVSKVLTLTEKDFGKTWEQHSFSRSSSSSGSRAPLVSQHKGMEAFNSPLKDDHFPLPADDTTTELLWPIDEWNAVLNGKGQSEGKLNALIERQTKEALEVAKSVFIKPKKELCDPKIPDFALVDKNFEDVPTAENVGALLFTQSTTDEALKSYCSTTAVGEAVAVAQILLKKASQQRQFVMAGVTNLRKIRWFRVERHGMEGEYIGSHCSEVAGAEVRHNLAGFMCCSLETVGVYKKSILVGQKTYHLGRWLGEGTTSNVYVVKVGNEECAVKVAKTGQSISMDVRNLENLEDIKGIPRIVMSDSPSHLFITPVAEQFTLELLFRKDMHTRLGELVDTLQCAHGRGIVNRDIRIANILIAKDQFIIVDWGFAAPLDKPYSYAGTTHFASAYILKMLEKGQDVFPVGGSDDLVSLVRSLYVVSRLNHMRVEVLKDLGTDEVAKIQEFWETEMKNNSQWLVAERYAENGDYTALKAWVESWIQITM